MAALAALLEVDQVVHPTQFHKELVDTENWVRWNISLEKESATHNRGSSMFVPPNV